ncbi:YbdD/YjiX family protein [Actinomycetospora soli]|uniref:YbdD/YjiX family protein n=1 Tax=Actinomycetospora soli TaxID=2893887 RepID=UPI001E6467BD|nr:YbdD/YjiX family protein [Actinomycetospora soli]MCD2186289.1 YbdD/YjiX family protein [Actinomycetospora soli]
MRALVRWWRGVIGADAYERYLESHHRRGHTHPPMGEREFWRAKVDAQEANPSSRCC